jgi:hypothetical protein
VWAARRSSRMVGHRIASLLKASPEGEGFHPSQTGTLSISGDYVRTIDYKIRNDRIGAKIASAVVEWAGKIWLFTLGPMGVRSSGGTLVAEIGPVPTFRPRQVTCWTSTKPISAQR